jgi:hypothetical protein
MPIWFKLATAGLSDLIWHWGIGVGLIICILAVEYFLGYLPFVQRIRKDLLWVAFGIAVFLVGEWLGARDMAARCNAQAAVVEGAVNQAVKDANGNPTKDKWDTNQ